jgi:CheY-like chemotaxis protein
VDVRVDPGDGQVVLEVRDTGIGIPPERQVAVFEHFVQADSSVAPRFGGTGLGLSISLRLAQLMGGDLDLKSEVGKGTSFFLTLPLKATSQLPRKAAAPMQPTPASEAPVGGRVLVVEDHDINQMLIATMLRQLGYRFEIMGDGAAGIAEIARGIDSGDPYTLVLMDMQMPQLDGIEATQRIRESGIDAEMLPIVALTANAFADDAAACFAAGMQAHLVKPVKLDDLSAVLRRWMPEQTIWRPMPVAANPASPDIDGLHERYRRRRDEALAMLDEMVRTGDFEDAALETLADAMHKLAGTAGMFGEAQIGAHAIAIEDGIENWPREELPRRITEEYEALRKSA